jgi:hypothetical protein
MKKLFSQLLPTLILLIAVWAGAALAQGAGTPGETPQGPGAAQDKPQDQAQDKPQDQAQDKPQDPDQGKADDQGAAPEGPKAQGDPATQEPLAPKLEFDSYEYDSGRNPAGTTITHDFRVTNKGTDALLIHEVIPGCGCTVVSFDKFIAPKKTGLVTVSVDLYREWAGQDFLKSVTVITNDPEMPRLRLLMRGKIGPPAGQTLNRVTPPPQPDGAKPQPGA